MKWLKRIVIALFSLALLGVGAIVAAYFSAVWHYNGKLTRKTDYTSAFEYFISGTEPKEYISETQDENNLFIDAPADDLFQ